ncbi:hypothetical protein [Candidatus Coxiella mudrowiae]|uniref:hypothetical protein n=1 Tax=Candidatus Coxiella mudrowiae TaxID=2054173 RepID=UPI0012FECDE2|nr:hypothetical protein [Candidatus Coxiella mudrowiae]
MAKPYKVPLDVETSKVIRLWYEQTKVVHKGRVWVFSGKNPGEHITNVKKS